MKATDKRVLKLNMKTKFLLIITLFSSGYAFSQESAKFGVKAGITISGIQGDASNSLNQLVDLTNGYLKTADRTGFYLGVNADIPIAENLSIEPGIYYSQKGYDLKGDFGIKGIEFLGASAKASLITQYIDLPVLLKGNFGGLLIFAGPQVSYLAKADLKITAGLLGIKLLNKSIDASGQFNPWDAAITGGIGYQFNNGMNITASYDYGLMKVDANQSVNAYNRAFKVGIGVNF